MISDDDDAMVSDATALHLEQVLSVPHPLPAASTQPGKVTWHT